MAREISEQVFTDLKSKGYTGGATLEDMMIPLNEKYNAEGKKYIDGKPWWMVEKDKAENKNKDFVDVIKDKLEKEILKNGN